MGPARAALLLALASCAPQESSTDAESGPGGPRNVVLIVVDDAGYRDFSFQGAESFPTPHIDGLAARSTRFTAAYATSSVCSPSRAALLTGRYQQRFGHEFNLPNKYDSRAGLREDQVTLADMLRERGYATLGVGKWHLGATDNFHPCERGFDSFFGFLHGARSYFPRADDAPRARLHGLVRDRGSAPEEFEYLTTKLGDEAVAAIETHADAPFFLFLSFSAVHVPLQAPDELLERVEGLTGDRRTLAAMTIALDDAVGRVLAALERSGLTDDTLIVFTNDNGGSETNAADNGVLRGGKGGLFEGGVRVPLLLCGPGVPEDVEYDPPVSLLDIVPTILAATGARPPAERDGVDLVPFVNGSVEGVPHERLFWRRGQDWAVREGAWKLVRQTSGEPALFDLEHDPGELRDLAAEQPERVAHLAATHAEWAATLAEPGWRSWVGNDKDDE